MRIFERILIFRRGICNAYLLFVIGDGSGGVGDYRSCEQQTPATYRALPGKKNDLSKGKENYRSKGICRIAQENDFSWKFKFRLKIFKNILHEPNLCTQIRV